MSGRDNRETEMNFSSSRESFISPASPPYNLPNSNSTSNLPPNYQSRTRIHQPNSDQDSNSDPSSNHSSLDKGKGSIRGESVVGGGGLNSAFNSPSQPQSALTQGYSGNGATSLSNSNDIPNPNVTPQARGPRIAVTDPLADMRERNLSKPEGLGMNSDWPRNAKNGMNIDTSSTLNYLKGSENNEKFSHATLPDTADFAKRPGLKRRDSDVSSDGGQHYDDFDWSDDDDLEEAARFEEAKAKEMRMGRLSLWKILRFLSVTFLGNFIISCALIVPVLVIHFVYRPKTNDNTPPDVASHRDYVADNIEAWFIWAAFNLHVEWWLHILVELIPRAVLGVISLAWGRPTQKVKSGAEFFDAIKNYVKLILYAALSWGSWAIIFNSIYGLYTRTHPETESRAKYLYRIYQVIEFFFFFILTLCAEKMLIKTIAMSFHASAYADRINEVTRNLAVFDRLKDYRPKSNHGSRAFGFSSTFGMMGARSGRATPTMNDFGAMADDEGSTTGGKTTPKQSEATSKKHSKKRPADQHSYPPSGTASPDHPQGAGASVPRTPGSQSLAGKVKGGISSTVKSNASRAKTTASQASKIARVAMNDPFGLLQREELGVAVDINSPSAAKKLAKSIFISFRGHHKRSYLIPTDFEPAYPTANEAKAAFSVFDRDGNGDISMTEIKNTVLSTYKERRFLSRSMQDVNHAVGQLDLIFLMLAMVIVLFEAFAIFNIDISKTLTTFYSLAIAFAFIFKESAQNVFDSIVFLFVTHPFDTGDRIQLDEAIMVVKRMSLLSSQFTLADGTDMYVSNALLASMMIINIRRSGYQWESATIQLDFNTPLEKIDAVEADMIHWLSTEPERLFEPSTAIVPQTINYMRYIECTIGMTHRANWQDWGARFYRKNAFFAALTYYLKKHGIQYVGSNQPIIYWKDDAEAPPYDDEGGLDDDDKSPLEDFSIEDENGPLSAGGNHQPKFRSFMNFTPPADELDNMDNGLRKRKARKKAMANQGGDG